jgi:TRAP-type mannitol/chloroaromatic compound transport system permease small subunit
MDFLLTITAYINRFTAVVGRIISWLCLLLVALVIIVVLSRYLLGVGSIAIQESVTYVHAVIFMLGLGYTLQQGGHVRVDIFYRNYSPRRQALVNLVGTVAFLIPCCLLILIGSWDYVMASWSIKESSSESGGIAAVYLLKTLMILMPITLGLQGIAEIINSIVVLKQGETEISTSNTEQLL